MDLIVKTLLGVEPLVKHMCNLVLFSRGVVGCFMVKAFSNLGGGGGACF